MSGFVGTKHNPNKIYPDCRQPLLIENMLMELIQKLIVIRLLELKIGFANS